MAEDQLLLDEYPLVILPQLAKRIGLNEAIILQQIHYWLQKGEVTGRNYRDGFFWVYNSYRRWQEQFPFWSLATIRRAIANLERMGLVVSGEYNKLAGDRSKWYRIDYTRLGVSIPSAQSDQTGVVKKSKPSAQDDTSNTRDYRKDYHSDTNNSKKAHGDFMNVLLSDKELEKLYARFTEDKTEALIQKLSSYMAQNPKNARKYKDHYATLLHWDRMDQDRRGNPVTVSKKPIGHVPSDDDLDKEEQ